jgi:hypothetical protein
MSGASILLRRGLLTPAVWMCLFVASVAWNCYDHIATVQTMMQPLRFAAMDSRDTFYLSSAGTFDTAQHIHAEVGKLAAETILNRNPDGYDDPDRLERLFNPATTASLKKAAAVDADTFKQQQIHQKFEAGVVKEKAVDSTSAIIAVEGQVVIHSEFEGRVLDQSKQVTVLLQLRANPDMAHNGRYPLVVTQYEVQFHS